MGPGTPPSSWQFGDRSVVTAVCFASEQEPEAAIALQVQKCTADMLETDEKLLVSTAVLPFHRLVHGTME
ncbi:hypothetical protein NDU88_004167 [Pleurodeles waltl]|uniref:Uncharacterized protein n=1 Tax=Pleurodeles waltl TaxID=8319 RepID=A0AAV7SI10_PLEWA|nr:hypothetical protein NDU88_004167 [Pleurodeles waltl]